MTVGSIGETDVTIRSWNDPTKYRTFGEPLVTASTNAWSTLLVLLSNGVDRAFNVPVGVPLGLPPSGVVFALLRGGVGFELIAGGFIDVALCFRDPVLVADVSLVEVSLISWVGVDVGVVFGDALLLTESSTALMKSTKYSSPYTSRRCFGTVFKLILILDSHSTDWPTVNSKESS